MKKDMRREEKIKKWFKDPQNLILVGIILLSFFIRLYYFNLTSQQPLWWDESEYMLKAKAIAFGTPETGWWEGRPILFSSVLSVILSLGFGESFIRFLLVLLSLGTVLMVYFLGKDLINKKTGLIASFLFSLFYLDLFYTFRIMTDVLSVFLGVLIFYLFFKSEKKPKLVLWLGPLIVISFLFRFPNILFFFIFGLYVLVAKREVFNNKYYWITALLGLIVLVPYLVWSQVSFGDPLHALNVAGSGAIQTPESGRFGIFFEYLRFFPGTYLHLILFMVLIIGLVYFLDLFLGFDKLLVSKDKELHKKLFVLIWLLVPLIYHGFFVNHAEDRYIFIIFPAIFYLIGFGSEQIYTFGKKYNKSFALVFVVLILTVGSYQLIMHSDVIIKSRKDSYDGLKAAGLWIKDHSSAEDIILSMGRPQNTYYSERETFRIPPTAEELDQNISAWTPKYLVLSIWEKSPEYSYSWPENKLGISAVQAFYQGEQATTIVYEFTGS